jgi:hypothetical protein
MLYQLHIRTYYGANNKMEGVEPETTVQSWGPTWLKYNIFKFHFKNLIDL